MTTLPSETICPYCRGKLSSASGNSNCPHCDCQVFNVACNKCGRRTINLSLLARYGKARCFSCQHEINELPGNEVILPAGLVVNEREQDMHPREAVVSITRIPATPVLPGYADAREAVEIYLRGLERAMLDRDVLRAPELRVVANRYIDTVHDLLALDSAMEQGEVNPASLHNAENLAIIARLCFQPLWQDDGSLLPEAIYAWLLTVDDAARRWQYARRKWLLSQCQLKMMQITPHISTLNPSRQTISGEGRMVASVTAPGFMLGDEILRKAQVIAE